VRGGGGATIMGDKIVGEFFFFLAKLGPGMAGWAVKWFDVRSGAGVMSQASPRGGATTRIW